MKMYKFFFIAFLLTLVSCDREIGHDPEDYDSYIVANSIVTTDSTWAVKLSYSKSIFNRTDFQPVLDAEVNITVLLDEENGQAEIQKFKLEDNGDGYYTRGSYPIQGRHYKLEIDKDDHQLTALTYVPKVLDAEIVEQRVIQTEKEENQETVEFDVKLNTDDNESNYYAWDVIPVFEEKVKEDIPDYDPETDDDPDNPDADDGDNLGPKDPTPILARNPSATAVPFQNESGKITISGNSIGGERITNILNESKESKNEENASPVKYKLRVWAISYDYYQYLVSLQQNAPASSDVDFVNPYSNIENGGGIFAGYALAEILLEL